LIPNFCKREKFSLFLTSPFSAIKKIQSTAEKIL